MSKNNKHEVLYFKVQNDAEEFVQLVKLRYTGKGAVQTTTLFHDGIFRVREFPAARFKSTHKKGVRTYTDPELNKTWTLVQYTPKG